MKLAKAVYLTGIAYFFRLGHLRGRVYETRGGKWNAVFTIAGRMEEFVFTGKNRKDTVRQVEAYWLRWSAVRVQNTMPVPRAESVRLLWEALDTEADGSAVLAWADMAKEAGGEPNKLLGLMLEVGKAGGMDWPKGWDGLARISLKRGRYAG